MESAPKGQEREEAHARAFGVEIHGAHGVVRGVHEQQRVGSGARMLAELEAGHVRQIEAIDVRNDHRPFKHSAFFIMSEQ